MARVLFLTFYLCRHGHKLFGPLDWEELTDSIHLMRSNFLKALLTSLLLLSAFCSAEVVNSKCQLISGSIALDEQLSIYQLGLENRFSYYMVYLLKKNNGQILLVSYPKVDI